MSGATIDIGIDLGTSNSSVAVARNGRVDILRNANDDHITPSVVRVLKNGAIQVGRKAYEHHRLSGDGSAQARFKRQMGKQSPYTLGASGREFSAEQLAAEVLKSLRADAERFIGEPLTSAVITVPAMFELVQCEATQRAAALAGITEAPLLQEPIAAGLAYGYERDLSDAYFLVYDFGGGTFDATLMRVSDGRLSVVGTAGDNFLGGRDWDGRLAGLIAQRLMDDGYELWTPDDPDGKEFRARLELFAEQEKIRLSQEESVEAFFDGELSDAAGSEIHASVRLTRAEYEHLIAADVERSLNVVQSLLDSQKVPSNAVASIVMVGGPTRTPLVRRMVSALTGIPVEVSIDPMTVVAHGAALYAATQVKESRSTATIGTGAMARLSLSYQSATDDDVAHVGGRVEEIASAGWSVEIARSDGGWSSGRIPVQGGAFFTTVALMHKRPNTFRITASDETGRVVPVEPAEFTIAQGIMVAEPPLARSVGIAAMKADGSVLSDVIVEKGSALPVVRRKLYRPVKEVRPGQAEDALNIEVFEGDHPRPELNRHVGTLSIPGTGLTRPIDSSTQIEITLRIDKNRRPTVKAYVPVLDQTFEEVLTNKIMQPEDPELVRDIVERAVSRMDHYREFAAAEVDRLEKVAQSVLEDLLAAEGGDQDRADRAGRGAKDVAAEVDALEAKYLGQRKVRDLQTAIEMTDNALVEHGTAEDRSRWSLIREQAAKVSVSGRIDEIDHVADEARRFYVGLVWEQPAFWIGQMVYIVRKLNELGIAAPRSLMESGKQAIDDQDLEVMRDVCLELRSLMPSDKAAGFDLEPVV